MLNLSLNTSNTIVYTATEFAGGTGATFSMKITNSQNASDIEYVIVDDSEYTTRYNRSYLYLTNSIEDWSIIDNYTIGSTQVKVANGDVTIGPTATLTINGTLILMDGSLTGSGSISYGASGATYSTTYAQYYELTDKTVLIDLLPGFYDYYIYDINDSLVEKGNMLINYTNNTIGASSYSPTINKVTYYDK